MGAPDRDVVEQAIVETGRRARGESLAGIDTQPLIDAKLAHRLDDATQTASYGSGAAGRVARSALRDQLAFNAALIDVCHQLVHLERILRDDLFRLEQRVATLERRAP